MENAILDISTIKITTQLEDDNPMLYSMFLHANIKHLTVLEINHINNVIETLKIKRDNIHKINCNILCDKQPDHESEIKIVEIVEIIQ